MMRKLGLWTGLGYLAAALLMYLSHDAFLSGIGGCRGLGTSVLLGATVVILGTLGLALLAHPVVGGICCLLVGGYIGLHIPQALLSAGSRTTSLEVVVVILVAVDFWVGVHLMRAWANERERVHSLPADGPEPTPGP